MSKFWQIVKYEYTRHVLRKRFIVTLLSLPLSIIGMVLLVLVIGFFMVNRDPIGYVDLSGVLLNARPSQAESTFFEPVYEMIALETEVKANIALEEGSIQAYFILPEDYQTNFSVPLYYLKNIESGAQNQIIQFVRQNLLADVHIEYETRLVEGTNFVLNAIDGTRQMRENEWANILIPFIVGFIFIIVVLTSGGYLLQAVVEEKENRTMEIIITSVSPMQLMAGKIVGNLSVGLTQLLVWGLLGWVTLPIAGHYVPFIANLKLSPNYILISLLLMLPTFVFVSALMATLGATVTETREAQQVSGFFTLPIMLPYYFATAIMQHPDGPIAVFLSFFPLSAPVALSMRMAFTTVPAWQIALIIALMISFAIFTIWLAGVAFRLGMLQYGKRITFGQLFRKEAKHV